MFGSLLTLFLFQAAPVVEEASGALELVEVRSARLEANREATASVSRVAAKAIAVERPTHPNDIFDRVPAAWVVRASGQEHLTALRSPVLTGPGACGAFLVLEDQVPIRPAGFCNVNELFEVDIAQASSIDVLRGPGTVVYGSNSLHGAIAFESRFPEPEQSHSIALQAGSDDFYRGTFALVGKNVLFQSDYTDAGSFRDDEDYTHAHANIATVNVVGAAEVRTRLAWSELDQNTAGFIPGQDAYKDPGLRRQNLNPDAFREGFAVRLTSQWAWTRKNGQVFELIPYARTSDMDFLQHFLPGTPLEQNGQDSAGLLFSWRNGAGLSAGVDVEWADGFLREYQAEALTTGSRFLQETRPQGFHYDYDVTAFNLAAWGQISKNISDNLQLIAGARTEYIDYDYTNHMLDGNTRDDGTECGFGGCLYTRPADRGDSFTNLAPELGLEWTLEGGKRAHLRLARGFRAPQATELYRLQSGQSVADLDTVTLDSLEAGIRGALGALEYDLVAYTMRKDNFIFRDAEGFNVSDGKSSHEGMELHLRWTAGEAWAITSNLSWASHEYDFDRDLARGEVIHKGNQIDTAPERLAAARIEWQPRAGRTVEAEWVYTGEYYLDASNRHDYGGHSLVNVRARISPGNGRHVIGLNLTNLLDEVYAERADFAFGEYRYFPGAGRRIFVSWEYWP